MDSRPDKFYRLAKIHKLKVNQGIGDLSLRPIISNIGTATYDLAKYLAKLLSPLSKSSYTVSSTNELVNILKNSSSTDCDLVSFDVTSLFTNFPLEYTIDVILRKVYEEKLIKTDIPKRENYYYRITSIKRPLLLNAPSNKRPPQRGRLLETFFYYYIFY